MNGRISICKGLDSLEAFAAFPLEFLVLKSNGSQMRDFPRTSYMRDIFSGASINLPIVHSLLLHTSLQPLIKIK